MQAQSSAGRGEAWAKDADARGEGEGDPQQQEENALLSLDAGEMDSLKLEMRKASLTDALFGVMYTLLKEKAEGSWKTEMLDVIIHFLQLYVQVLSNNFRWTWDLNPTTTTDIGNAEMDNLFQFLGYSSFVYTFWVLFAILMVSLLICAWVAQNFKTGKFPFVWPIKLARVFVGFFFSTFYLTSLSVFELALACNFFDYKSKGFAGPTMSIFPDVRCDKPPHVFILCFSVPATILTAIVSYLLTIGRSEMDPLTPGLTAVNFPVTSTKIFLWVTMLDTFNILFRGKGVTFGVITIAICVYVIYALLRWMPYVTDWINQLECGMYTAMLYMGIILVYLTVAGAPYHQHSMMALYGIPPSFVVGWCLMTIRLRSPRAMASKFRKVQIRNSLFDDQARRSSVRNANLSTFGSVLKSMEMNIFGMFKGTTSKVQDSVPRPSGPEGPLLRSSQRRPDGISQLSKELSESKREAPNADAQSSVSRPDATGHGSRLTSEPARPSRHRPSRFGPAGGAPGADAGRAGRPGLPSTRVSFVEARIPGLSPEGEPASTTGNAPEVHHSYHAGLPRVADMQPERAAESHRGQLRPVTRSHTTEDGPGVFIPARVTDTEVGRTSTGRARPSSAQRPSRPSKGPGTDAAIEARAQTKRVSAAEDRPGTMPGAGRLGASRPLSPLSGQPALTPDASGRPSALGPPAAAPRIRMSAGEAMMQPPASFRPSGMERTARHSLEGGPGPQSLYKDGAAHDGRRRTMEGDARRRSMEEGHLGSLYESTAGSKRRSMGRVGPMGSVNRAGMGGSPPASQRRSTGRFSTMMDSNVPQFASPREVEVVARCMRIRDEFGNLVEEWVQAAERVMAAGLRQFPDDPQLRLFVSHYLLHVKKNPAKSSAQLKIARNLPMSLGLRFQIFCRDREATQAGGGGGLSSEGAMDLVAYVEFSNNFKAVQKSHTQALRVTREFWRRLMVPGATFDSLTDLVNKAAAAKHSAESIFRAMLQQHPRNVKLLRAYGRFVGEVANNPWRAARQFEMADRIEDAQAQARREKLMNDMSTRNAGLQPSNSLVAAQSSLARSLDGGGKGGGASLFSQENGGSAQLDGVLEAGHVDDARDSVIVINENGIILMTNRLFNRMFGYKMGELEGLNVSSLMPQPFSAMHNSFLRNFKNSGEAHVMGMSREVVGQSKDRLVFPINLLVTRLVQSDGTVQFMGVIKSKRPEPGVGEIWVGSSGTILCASAGFQDIFGWTSKELTGQNIDSVSAKKGILHAEFTAAMDAVLQLDEENMEAAADGQPPPNTEAEFAKVAFECSIRHKWSRAAVATSWKVVPCSTPYYRILRLVGTPEQGKGAGCIVIDTDSKAVYASPAVETELGYSTSEMATRGITLDRLIPGATAGLHGMLLKGFLRRRTVPSQDVPCFNNHVVSLVSKKKTLVPFRMAWRNQREGEDVLFVVSLTPASHGGKDGSHPWGLDDAGSVPDRQTCLRLLVSHDGEVVAAADGLGFDPKGETGSVFGIEGASLVGTTLDLVVEIMDAVVKNTSKYNASVDSRGVMRMFLRRLAEKHTEMGCVSYRSGIYCPPEEAGRPPTVVPGRIVVVPADVYGLNLSAMEQAGLLSKRAAAEARKGRSYVVECWSANWLSGDVTAAADGTVRSVDHRLGLITGRPDGELLGRTLQDLFVSRGPMEAVMAELRRGGERLALDMVHFDGSAISCSVTGIQSIKGRKALHVIVRSLPEEAQPTGEALRRVETLMMRFEEDQARAAALGHAPSEAGSRAGGLLSPRTPRGGPEGGSLTRGAEAERTGASAGPTPRSRANSIGRGLVSPGRRKSHGVPPPHSPRVGTPRTGTPTRGRAPSGHSPGPTRRPTDEDQDGAGGRRASTSMAARAMAQAAQAPPSPSGVAAALSKGLSGLPGAPLPGKCDSGRTVSIDVGAAMARTSVRSTDPAGPGEAPTSASGRMIPLDRSGVAAPGSPPAPGADAAAAMPPPLAPNAAHAVLGRTLSRKISFRGSMGYGFEPKELKAVQEAAKLISKDADGTELPAPKGSPPAKGSAGVPDAKEKEGESTESESEAEGDAETEPESVQGATVAETHVRGRAVAAAQESEEEGWVDKDTHVQSEGFLRAERFQRLHRLLRGARVATMGKALARRSLALVVVAIAVHAALFAFFVSRVTAQYSSVSLAGFAEETTSLPVMMSVEATILQDYHDGGAWSTVLNSDAGVRSELTRYARHLELAQDTYIHHGMADARSGGGEVPVVEFLDNGDNVTTTRGLFPAMEDAVQRAMLLASDMAVSAAGPADARVRYLLANAAPVIAPAMGLNAVSDGDRAMAGLHSLARSAVTIALVHALLVVPLCVIVLAGMIVELNRARSTLFSLFFAVPRSVIAFLATRDVQVEGAEQDEAAKMADSHWEHGVLTDADAKAAEGIRQDAKSYLQNVRLEGSSAGDEFRAHSARQILVLVAPLLALSALLLGTHLACFGLLTSAFDPAVNYLVVQRTYAVHAELLASANDFAVSQGAADAGKSLVDEASALDGLWQALLFGTSQPVPGVGGGRRVPGQIHNNPQLSQVMYTSECLRTTAMGDDPEQATCIQSGSDLYTQTHNGLELLMRYTLSSARQLAGYAFDPSQPAGLVQSAEFQLLWMTKADMQAGLWRIAQVLEASVTMRIGGVVILEVVALVVAVVITGMYVKLLKPYISKACIEVERAADLLAQLPVVLPVEDFVSKAMDAQSDMDVFHNAHWTERLSSAAGSVLLRCILGSRAKVMLSLEEQYMREQARERRRLEREEDVVGVVRPSFQAVGRTAAAALSLKAAAAGRGEGKAPSLTRGKPSSMRR